MRSEDRRYLETALLPLFADKSPVLFVGVHPYTEGYAALIGRGAEMVSIDVRPVVEFQGRRARPDRVLDVTDPAFAARIGRRFNGAIFNGVIGWGVDDQAGVRRALANLTAALNEGGWLLVGWNAGFWGKHVIEDGEMLALVAELGLAVRPVEGRPIFRGEPPWEEAFDHRYLLAVKGSAAGL